MASRQEQHGQKDSSGEKPVSDMDPEGMDSEFEGDDDLDSEDEASQSTSRPEHNRRESDKNRVSPPSDRER
jgi:hypothetical protein